MPREQVESKVPDTDLFNIKFFNASDTSVIQYSDVIENVSKKDFDINSRGQYIFLTPLMSLYNNNNSIVPTIPTF